MNMHALMADAHVETFLALDLETWAIAYGNQYETDGGNEEEKDHDNTDHDISLKMARASNDHGEDSS